MTKNTLRNYRSLMRKLWLRIQADPANATLEMWGQAPLLRACYALPGIESAGHVLTGKHQAQAWKLVARNEPKASAPPSRRTCGGRAPCRGPNVTSGCQIVGTKYHALNRWRYRLLRCSRDKSVARPIPLIVTFLPATLNLEIALATLFVVVSTRTR
jgi:hypothetical protein